MKKNCYILHNILFPAVGLGVIVLLLSCDTSNISGRIHKQTASMADTIINDTGKAQFNNEELKKILPKDVYEVAREKGTERPFTGKYWDFKEIGTYYCAVCGTPLFKSDGKFESSCGWPSFFEPITKKSLLYELDTTYAMRRTEVKCATCNSHLGHVFEDGPPPTGLRYCINSVVLNFTKKSEAGK